MASRLAFVLKAAVPQGTMSRRTQVKVSIRFPSVLREIGRALAGMREGWGGFGGNPVEQQLSVQPDVQLWDIHLMQLWSDKTHDCVK